MEAKRYILQHPTSPNFYLASFCMDEAAAAYGYPVWTDDKFYAEHQYEHDLSFFKKYYPDFVIVEVE